MNTSEFFKQQIDKIGIEIMERANNSLSPDDEIFRTIVDISPNLILVIQDEKIVFANSSAIVNLGYKSFSEIEGESFEQFVHTEDVDQIIKLIEDSSNGKLWEPIVIKYFVKNISLTHYAEIYPISVFYCGHSAILLIGRDVTEEHMLKLELAEKENLLEQTERITKTGNYKISLLNGKAFWTKGVYDIFDYPYNKAIPDVNEYYSYVHPDDVDELKHHLNESIAKNTPFDFKYRINSLKNELKYVHSKSEVVIENNEKFLVGTFRDITEEYNTEKEIIEKQEYINTILDTLYEGVSLNQAIYNDEGEVVDYKVLYANESFNNHSFYNREDILNKLASDCFEMPSDFIRDWWIKAKDKEFPIQSELYQEHTGRWSCISTSSITKEHRFVTSFFDITETVKNRKSLEESEQKYRKLIDDLPLGYVKFSKSSVLYANNETKKMLGFAENTNLLNKAFLDFVSETEQFRFNVILCELEKQKQAKDSRFVITLIDNKKKLVHTEMNIYKAKDNNEGIVYECLIEDITNKMESRRDSKKLLTDAVFLSRKIETYEQIRLTLDAIIKKEKLNKTAFISLYNKLKDEWNLEQLWAIFQSNYEKIESNFFKKLIQICPEISQQELKHCAFIRLNFETKEIAAMFQVKASSIQIARVRLKKKLKLTSEQDLIAFIHML